MSSAPRPSARLLAGLLAAALGVAGCSTCEVTTPIPGRRDAMARSVAPLTPTEHWSWIVESGRVDGRRAGAGERLAAGVRLTTTADAGLSASAAAQSVEEYVPAALPVGRAHWVTGAAGPDGGIGGEVAIDWMIGLKARGTCSVDVELVPRLTPACGDPVFLEGLRIHRTIEVGDAILLSADPGAPSPAARLLVGGDEAGRRLAIRIRR